MKIISGGQTGADRAALDAAMEAGVPCGGWCPAGRKAEDGVIPDHYPVIELPGAGYVRRTRQNVIDSDGTLVVSFGPPEGGTARTVRYCKREGKPFLVIDANVVSPTLAAGDARRFVSEHRVQTTNVAGPRASNQPEIYEYTAKDIATWQPLFDSTGQNIQLQNGVTFATLLYTDPGIRIRNLRSGFDPLHPQQCSARAWRVANFNFSCGPGTSSDLPAENHPRREHDRRHASSRHDRDADAGCGQVSFQSEDTG